MAQPNNQDGLWIEGVQQVPTQSYVKFAARWCTALTTLLSSVRRTEHQCSRSSRTWQPQNHHREMKRMARLFVMFEHQRGALLAAGDKHVGMDLIGYISTAATK